LNTTQADAKLFSGFSEAQTTSDSRSDGIIVYGLLSTLVDPSGFRFGDAFGLPLPNHAALELSHCAHHAQHEFLSVVLLAGEDQSFLVEPKLDSTSLETLYERQKILQAPSETINAVNVDGVTFTDEPEHLLKRWTLRGGPTHLVLEDLIQIHPVQLAGSVLVC